MSLYFSVCDTSCATCVDGTTCTSCHDNTFLLLNSKYSGVCVTSSQCSSEGLKTENKYHTCYNQTLLKECRGEGLRLYEGECVEFCPKDTYIQVNIKVVRTFTIVVYSFKNILSAIKNFKLIAYTCFQHHVIWLYCAV